MRSQRKPTVRAQLHGHERSGRFRMLLPSRLQNGQTKREPSRGGIDGHESNICRGHSPPHMRGH